MVKYKTIEQFARESGYSETAVQLKIENGVWPDGVHIKAPDGLILISVEGYNEWVESGVVTPSKRASQSPKPVSTGSEPKLVKPKEARETTRPEAATGYKERGVEGKLLTEKQVSAIVCFKRSKIFNMIKAGEFPAPKKFGYVNRWLNSDIEEWLEGLKKKD